MPDWDEDSAQLRDNLTRVLEILLKGARERRPPTVEEARSWQTLIFENLNTPIPLFTGRFRGESGLEDVQVRVGSNFGVSAVEVPLALAQFETKLQQFVAELDAMLPAGQDLKADELAAILDLCAWAHSEWIRIHPFANGNGRTARLWANSIAMRYGLPPFLRLRPRPGLGYAEAGASAMQGNWKPTTRVFRRMLDDFLE